MKSDKECHMGRCFAVSIKPILRNFHRRSACSPQGLQFREPSYRTHTHTRMDAHTDAHTLSSRNADKKKKHKPVKETDLSNV